MTNRRNPWSAAVIEKLQQQLLQQKKGGIPPSSATEPSLETVKKEVVPPKVKELTMVRYLIPTGARYLIGIDPGTHTGFAVYSRDAKQMVEVKTLDLLEAQDRLRTMKHVYGPELLHVRWEDARQREWYGKAGKERLKGVGAIEKECSLWEKFFEREGITNEPVAPKNLQTKVSPGYFKTVTGWKGTSTEHSRDAGMAVYGK